MKKFFKALALVLALALVVGVVPAQTASAKVKAKKTLYVDGAKGTSKDEKTKSSYKEKVALYKLAGDKKADKDDHEYTATIKSGKDVVSVSKKYVTAEALGKAVVEITRDGESLGTTAITVKKNADAETLKLMVKEGDEFVKVTADTAFVAGVTYRFALPRTKADTDERRLFVDDKAVEDVKDLDRQYDVVFDAGEHTIVFEAFQSKTLDAATAEGKVTITAKKPQALEAKQVSANSFKVTFSSAMKVNGKNLIDKDSIESQDIYYLILQEKVVTGVVKTVDVDEKNPTEVTITMYSNFLSDKDYYFAYGDADAIKFHTAKNDIKTATELRLIEQKAYYVGAETAVVYKFYNADGVELDITDQTPTLTYESDVAYLTGEKIYFFKEGTATIKASIITGYEDDTNAAIKLEATPLTVTGVTKTASQTGKTYSFGVAPSKEQHTIRLGDAAVELRVNYKLSDGNDTTIETQNLNPDGYYLRSADETIAVIKNSAGTKKDLVEAVNKGKTYIILCDADGKEKDAFAIEVLEANRVSEVDVKFSQDALNLATRDKTNTFSIADEVDLLISAKNLNGVADGNYTYIVEQATNNADAVKVTWNETGNGGTAYATAATTPETGVTKITFKAGDFTDSRATDAQAGVAVVRFTVTVKDANGTKVATKNISLAVSKQDEANSWKLYADETALDTSIKNWKTKDIANGTYMSTISAKAVKTASGYNFFVKDEEFFVINNQNSLPTTGSYGDPAENYVIVTKPSGANSLNLNGADATTAKGEIYVNAFTKNSSNEPVQATTGTFTFTGYHVEFDQNNKAVRSNMGTVNVMISKSDVAPTVEVLLGTAKEFEDNLSNPGDIFRVTWEGIASDTTDPAETGRVTILSLNGGTRVNYKKDDNTGAYFVYSVHVTLKITKAPTNSAGDETDPAFYVFTKEVPVNKLFKDK